MGGEESKCGYQISRVIPNSPAHAAGLLPFFDFIIGVDGVAIEEDGPYFKDYLRTHLQQTMCLEIYNSRVKNTRRVPITPNEHWGGQGVLGCSITWENIDKAFLCAWRILDIQPGSNAEKAALKPYVHFVIGMEPIKTSDAHCTMFSDEHDFHRRLSLATGVANDPQSKRFQNFNVLFLLYDSVENTIYEQMVQLPLGCEVGNGLMHTITASKGDPRLPVISYFYNAGSSNVDTTTDENAAANYNQYSSEPGQQLPPPQMPNGMSSGAPPPYSSYPSQGPQDVPTQPQTAYPGYLPPTTQPPQQYTQQQSPTQASQPNQMAPTTSAATTVPQPQSVPQNYNQEQYRPGPGPMGPPPPTTQPAPAPYMPTPYPKPAPTHPYASQPSMPTPTPQPSSHQHQQHQHPHPHSTHQMQPQQQPMPHQHYPMPAPSGAPQPQQQGPPQPWGHQGPPQPGNLPPRSTYAPAPGQGPWVPPGAGPGPHPSSF